MSQDIVHYLLALVRQESPQLGDEAIERIDRQVRDEFGGDEVYIPKKRIPAAKKQKAVADYIEGQPLQDIGRRNGLSRRTLYRALKQKIK